MTANKQDTVAISRDRDGWIIDTGTGALIGPDPQIERELTDEELARSRPIGRPALPPTERRAQITMRWSPETIEALKATGPGWTRLAEEAVKRPEAPRKVTLRHPDIEPMHPGEFSPGGRAVMMLAFLAFVLVMVSTGA